MKRPAPAAPPADKPAVSVSGSFKEAPEEYPKRLTLDLTEEQHRKFKVYAITNGTSMNKLLRDYIDSL
ncbi:chromosome partitioning protein ParB [Arthrobacter ulcerisalmonis]|nr:chromosome partitioning protein ParB [Arthrobacter ulcerisalmonis]